jgi:hypothetical protein
MLQTLLSAALATHAYAGGDDSAAIHDVSSPEQELAWAREAELGLLRVYTSDTEWTFALSVATPETQVTGSLTWRYDGQQVYSDAARPPDRFVTYTEPDFVLTGIELDAEEYLDFRMVDHYGRRWLVESVDEILAVEELIAAGYPPGEDPGEDWIAGIEFNPDAGLVHALELTSWTISQCLGEAAVMESAFWVHDDSGPLAVGPTTEPEDGTSLKMVAVRSGDPGVDCSGSLIRSDLVLTAAHCVTDADGNPLSPITVCGAENLTINGVGDCWAVGSTVTPGTWTGTNPYVLEKDWALLWLDESVNLGVGPSVLPVTDETALTIHGEADHIRGYATWDENCLTNVTSDDCATSADDHFGRNLWSTEDGIIVYSIPGIAGPYARWRTSFARGMSGAPHFMCIGGDCADAEITGVQAATQNMCGGASPCATGYAVGPHAIHFRQAIATFMQVKPVKPPAITCPTGEAQFVAPVLGVDVTLVEVPDASPSCGPGGQAPPESSLCGDILVYSPGAAQGGCTGRPDKAVVYFPGSGNAPRENVFVTDMAWHAGYRTIGLSYSNSETIENWCDNRDDNPVPGSAFDFATLCQTDHRDECAYYARHEKVTGLDPLGKTTFVNGDPAEYAHFDPFPIQDSIIYRLVYAFERARQLDVDDGQDDCHWGDFVDPDGAQVSGAGGGTTVTFLDPANPMSAINWEMIVVGGFSQGSGMAALIALEHEVGGLFLLEGPSDSCLETAGILSSAVPASYVSALVDGVMEPSGGAPRFGVWHRLEDDALGSNDARPTTWDNDVPDHDGPLAGLRMNFCADQAWDVTTDVGEDAAGVGQPPLRVEDFPATTGVAGFRGMTIFTDQTPAAGDCGFHTSVAVSETGGPAPKNCMPTDATSGAAATVASQAHLFEAYVHAFCAMDTQ